MTIGNIKSERPDVRLLFGPLSPEENTLLLERLLAVDTRLTRLAEHATRHVGVHYEPLGLGQVICSDGSSAGIDGGPSGEAGDIWFDISPVSSGAAGTSAGSAWEVVSRIVVFCIDEPEPCGDSNCHDLLCLEGVANAPQETLDLLESHVSIIEQQLDQYPLRSSPARRMQSCLNAVERTVVRTRFGGRINGHEDQRLSYRA